MFHQLQLGFAPEEVGAPDPLFASSYTVADWVGKQSYPFNYSERLLLKSFAEKSFTCEPTSLRDLHSLRILFWMVVGHVRASI